MPLELMTNTYANFGVFGLITFAFFAMVYYEIKSNEKREAKLHKIIDTLSKELPMIRETLDEIKGKVMKD